MKPIIGWELRQRRSALMGWLLACVVLTAVLLLIYPSIRDQSHQLNKVINQLPAGLRGLKTGSSASVDVGSAVGFLNSQVYYATLPILFIILAISRGSALIGRDEHDHTLELLLSRPISRGRLLVGKAISGALELLLVGAATSLVVIVLGHAVKLDISIARLVLVGLYTTLFSLSFGAIALAISAVGRLTKRASTGLAIFLSLGGYLITSLSGLTHYLIAPARFAPYHYFVPDKILNGQPVNGLNLYLLGCFVLTGLVAYFGFRRRDID